MLLSALIVRMRTFTGGAWPLVARARAPVCPSLAIAMPLLPGGCDWESMAPRRV